MVRIAFNTELPAGQAPEWVQLIPAGPHVEGRDGRSWVFDEASASLVLNAFTSRGMPVPIDWEHASERLAPKGQEAPAAGWIDRLELRGDRTMWGHVEWTQRAANQVASREYRYLSPAFWFDPKTMRIKALDSVGLTNNPNLRLIALNEQARNLEDEDMDLKALCTLLGLAETATVEQIVQAVTGLKADLDKATNKPQPAALPKALCTALGINDNATAEQAAAKVGELAKAAVVDMSRFAPRADLEIALNRASDAEGKLKKIEVAAREAEIVAAVDAAQAAGKFAPASREFYLAMCRKEGGLEEFKAFAASAPQVIAEPELPGKPKAGEGGKALNAMEAEIAAAFGNTPEDLAKYGK